MHISIEIKKISSKRISFTIKNNFDKTVYLHQKMFAVFSLRRKHLGRFIPILMYNPIDSGTPALLPLKKITIEAKKLREISFDGKIYSNEGLELDKKGIYKTIVQYSFSVEKKSEDIAVAKPPFTTIESEPFAI